MFRVGVGPVRRSRWIVFSPEAAGNGSRLPESNEQQRAPVG